MKVSFAVTTHNEGEYVGQLLSQLHSFLLASPHDSEVVVLDDYSDDPVTVKYLDSFKNTPKIQVHQRSFARDFAAHKNHLNGLCTGDYIFQLDADETIAPLLLTNLHEVLKLNQTVDLYLVPRVNIVDGLTPEHINLWGWNVNENGWVMWPDYQTRLYKNTPTIHWAGEVHERIVGFTEHVLLPARPEYALMHRKTIQRQEQQNALYATIGH